MLQVTKEIESSNWQQGSASNLSKNLKQALHNLSFNKNIVIKPSDKGGNLVIMDTDQYERMCYDIILNKTWYRSVPVPVNYYATKYYEIIAWAKNKGIIDQKTLEFLNTTNFTTPTFYALPKVHKNLSCPPGRPIISGCGSLTGKASQLVDEYLYPHVKGLFSYVKDTIKLLKITDGLVLPPGCWLVAIDNEALHNSIPHARGVEVIREFLAERDIDSQK